MAVSRLVGFPTSGRAATTHSGLCSRAGVGVAVDVEKPRRVHRRVDLRRGQARVAQQLLKRPQIRSARQQVRREAVPESMRR